MDERTEHYMKGLALFGEGKSAAAIEALGDAVAAAVASWRFEPPAAKRARFFFTVLAPASG